MPLFDAHLHLFSRRYFEVLAAQSPLPGSVEERLAALARALSLEIPGPDLAAHVGRWLAELDRHGVERAVAFSSAPEESEAVAQAAALSRGRLVPVALVNPKVPGAPERVRALLEAQGFRGLLLFPALHHVDLAGLELREVARVASERRAVLYVQCGLLRVPVRDALGLPTPVDLAYANPLSLVPVATAFPQVPFVVPHLGAGFFREALMLASQCPNVHLDTSSSNSWIATEPAGLTLPQVLKRALDVLGPTRLLFGTDSATFPRGFRRELLDAQRRALSELGVSSAHQAAILGGNAERLFTSVPPTAGSRSGGALP